jgi:xylulose-5-phosphate/fructose-6-phosphate phosphoketolase
MTLLSTLRREHAVGTDRIETKGTAMATETTQTTQTSKTKPNEDTKRWRVTRPSDVNNSDVKNSDFSNSAVTKSKWSRDQSKLVAIDQWWRAANYLSVGQIYLLNNALLREPLQHAHVKPRLVGHWGTTPGLNFIYAHMNRAIVEQDLSVLFLAGPGHGGPALVANAWLEGTYSEVYPNVSLDADGMTKLFRQFSFPGGIPSHAAPETPGSIHEGGELGYVLSHAFGAVFDNPDLIALAVVGDGEAETGPLATGWHGNKFVNPIRDGAVLPVLHLNGYKIANPAMLARIPPDELDQLLCGYGWEPHYVEGHDPVNMHRQMAEVVDTCVESIQLIQRDARANGFIDRPRWPMIVLRSPKGWTCPEMVDGHRVEGSWRSHQVPLANLDSTEHLAILEEWLRSYKPEELFDKNGAPKSSTIAISPHGDRRMSANPHANGGSLLHDLVLPDLRTFAVDVESPGCVDAEATRVQGKFLAEVMRINSKHTNFRIFAPDENSSNRWQDILNVTNRCLVAQLQPEDDHVSANGRIMEVLSEHQCQGWLEGYLLTGRHGFFTCYEAFIHIVDSMFNQHAKWLKVCLGIGWREPVASLNYLLTSHVWRQDHNGFSHQDPGFLDHVVNKKSEVIRVYLPPDANTLLAVTDECLRSRDKINVVVAGKQPAPQWLNFDDAVAHVERGLGVWSWASNEEGGEPDVVIASCGDVPTMEALGAVKLLRELIPDVHIRFVNVVDLMRLQDEAEHPHGLSHRDFDQIFTTDKPIIFAFHGYPALIHRLTYRRTNHDNLHVRGYKEEGTTTTPFDMVVLNDLDRFHLAMDVIDRVPGLGVRAAGVKQFLIDERLRHKHYIVEHGEDLPEIQAWRWDQSPSDSPTTGTAGDNPDDSLLSDTNEPKRTWFL